MTRFILIAALAIGQAAVAQPVRYENRRISRTLPGCGDAKEGCAHAELNYVEVVSGPPLARERIDAAILAFVTGGGMDRKPTVTPESFAQNYIDSFGSVYKEEPSWPPSSLTRTAGVLRSAAPVFSLEFYEVSTGGVHPLSTTRYYNFDPVTGEPVKLFSILKEGALPRLTAIAEMHFRKKRGLAATAKLEDEALTFPGGRFALNDNYGFSEKALLFFYNEYEITGYAEGTTLVEIPYAEMRDLICAGFPL
jgi:hypothetical protein